MENFNLKKYLSEGKLLKERIFFNKIKVSNYLNEIGDGTTKKYEWEEIKDDELKTIVWFTTDNNINYEVNLEYFTSNEPTTKDLPGMSIGFSADIKGNYDFSNTVIVNKGEIYKVMATIVDIIKYYLKDNKVIMYTPEKKSGEDFGEQRDKLYKIFITKKFPNAEFIFKGGSILAYLK
jgi:hypothetical protein